jgi:hypothetical protein
MRKEERSKYLRATERTEDTELFELDVKIEFQKLVVMV